MRKRVRTPRGLSAFQLDIISYPSVEMRWGMSLLGSNLFQIAEFLVLTLFPSGQRAERGRRGRNVSENPPPPTIRTWHYYETIISPPFVFSARRVGRSRVSDPIYIFVKMISSHLCL